MFVYCVSYDLGNEKQDYEGLQAELKRSSSWWHHLKSTWLVATPESADQLYLRIRPYINEEESVLIIRVTSEKSGWLPKKAWDWIGKHL